MTKIKKITRRDALKVGLLGMASGLAACSPLASATEALLPTATPFPTHTRFHPLRLPRIHPGHSSLPQHQRKAQRSAL